MSEEELFSRFCLFGVSAALSGVLFLPLRLLLLLFPSDFSMYPSPSVSLSFYYCEFPFFFFADLALFSCSLLLSVPACLFGDAVYDFGRLGGDAFDFFYFACDSFFSLLLTKGGFLFEVCFFLDFFAESGEFCLFRTSSIFLSKSIALY